MNKLLFLPCLDERFVWMVFKPLVAFISCDDCSISTDVQWLNVALNLTRTCWCCPHGSTDEPQSLVLYLVQCCEVCEWRCADGSTAVFQGMSNIAHVHSSCRSVCLFAPHLMPPNFLTIFNRRLAFAAVFSISLCKTKYVGFLKKSDFEHWYSKSDFFLQQFVLHRLILWNVIFKMTHVLPLISSQNCDKMHFKIDAAGLILIKSGFSPSFSVLSFSQNMQMNSIFAAQYLQKYYYVFWQHYRNVRVGACLVSAKL